jgi:hypothetical protein
MADAALRVRRQKEIGEALHRLPFARSPPVISVNVGPLTVRVKSQGEARAALQPTRVQTVTSLAITKRRLCLPTFEAPFIATSSGRVSPLSLSLSVSLSRPFFSGVCVSIATSAYLFKQTRK